ncbi:hypothetical protein [Streptomyces sp. NBC_01408]|uniref:hypothetical protein n=1 Tax=Streptomyces sp. NBC_01408 TaxID=2903855 RepID=UPI00225A4F74|nr:hypothetical protein [Streptomyces sp. NBC_01408]MCX4695685.1 hypothetical protein [Streptomyces sp. NBC_01408]
MRVLSEALLAAAAAGGAAVAQAAGTDAWTTMRARLARLSGRRDAPQEQAEVVLLDATGAALSAALDPHAAEAERTRQTELWTAWFAATLERLPEAGREQVAAGLHALLDGPRPAPDSGGGMTHNVVNGPAFTQVGDHNHQTIHLGTGA